ncbi:unnamed protein product [Leptidea sinapis]|uniref:BTB domain-containing protein n=1 Tax=Leptidea sinapis TaxID=189913 RepID=A0A5E4QCD1_9NEOP|nr:unnamed protein product [Leptidea sinapis]
MTKFEPDCTRRCKSNLHGQTLTSAITKRSVSDLSLASFVKATCFNFTKSFDYEGRTPLHMAASRGRNVLLEWLAKHSSEAFLNMRDKESGYTPLHRSILYGQIHSAVSLLKLGCNIDILDKDDYKAIEFAMLDREYICKVEKAMPCDVYVWGSNSNYTLGTGSHQPKNVPDMLTSFNRSNEDVRQVCLGKFHSVWVCASGSVWCAGQPSRAGGSTNTALRPTLLRLPEPCRQVALTLTSTVFLLQSGAMIQYASNAPDSTNPSPKVTTVRHQISNPLGVSAGRSHAVLWNAHAVYTWGVNMGQLGHPVEEKSIATPKRVAISMNAKEDTKFELADASDAATVITTSRGDVYLLHKYICKKIAVKQINLQQVCVESKMSETGVYSRVTVLLLTNVGQLMIWQDVSNRLTRCVFGLSHQVKITYVALTHDALYFTTKYGEAFIGHISRKATPPPAQPIKKDKDRDNKSALVKFLEKDDCTIVKITRIPNVHRGTAIAVDNEGLNFACLQNKPICGLLSIPELSPSGFSKHMESLMELASDDDLLHDVIFKVGLKLFPAHIFIIASSSDFLYKLYQEASVKERRPTIPLDNVHPEAFERILKYMYTGTCDVAEMGPCALKIRKEDLIGTKEKPLDLDDVIENPSEISAFEVYKSHEKRRNNKRKQNNNNSTPTRTPHVYCDPVKLVQATAKRLQVMGLHKLLDKFYYRDGTVCLKESATHTKNSPQCWDRDSYHELVDTNVCSKDGMLISAHKCVLAARLEYFNGMFMHSWTESKLLSKVTLPVNHGILLPVINFLYTDKCPDIETSDSIDFICSMLIVSDQLFIGRLREMCEIALGNLITLKNCTELCQFAHTYNATQLKQCCMEYISLNLANILENRLLDYLEDKLLEDITKYYCKFNPIMAFRVITPFSNAPDDETVEECLKNYPIDLQIIDEECKRDSFIESKKKVRSKKVEYTENEKARMRYESVSSVTSLDETSGDITLSLRSISKETNKSSEIVDKWTTVPTQKQQKLVQARLKAITAAKDILNEKPLESFTKLTKNSHSQESPTTSRMSVSPKDSPPMAELVNRTQGNLVINHVGPKLSQKQRKKLAFDNVTPQTLDNYLSNKLSIGSPPEPKNPWKIIEAPIASSSPKGKAVGFDHILADQKKQKGDSSRIMTKSLILTQLEDKAIEELERFYNIHEVDDEHITVSRIELQVSSPQWIHTVPK